MYWLDVMAFFWRNNLSFSVLNDYHPPNYWPTPAKKLPRAKEHYWKYITERIKQFVSNGMKTLVLRDNRDTRPTNFPFKIKYLKSTHPSCYKDKVMLCKYDPYNKHLLDRRFYVYTWFYYFANYGPVKKHPWKHWKCPQV